MVQDSVLSLWGDLQTGVLPNAIQLAISLSPLVLAIFLGKVFWGLWVDYVRGKNFLSIKYTLLELKLPKETYKSPVAMEIFLTSLHNTSDGSKFAQYWKGETRPWYSLEIASVEGQVKFYIWTEDRRKVNLISGLYSQFPGIEVSEAEDYTKSVHFDPKVLRIWAAEMKFSMDDPWLIRTYIEFGLDKDPKEEYKADPLLPLLEFLGSAGPNTQIWVQILIRGHAKDSRLPGHLFKKGDLWKIKQQELINKLLLRNPKTKVSGSENEKGFLEIPYFTRGETGAIEALERSTYKKAFDVGIRTLYISKKEQFSPQFGIGGIIGSFSQFGAEGSNAIRPNGDKWHPSLSDPWQDFMNIRRNRFAQLALQAYKMRSYFYTPFESKPMVMNTEELATIYHFPGSVAQTPTLERVASKKSQAPGNLPI